VSHGVSQWSAGATGRHICSIDPSSRPPRAGFARSGDPASLHLLGISQTGRRVVVLMGVIDFNDAEGGYDVHLASGVITAGAVGILIPPRDDIVTRRWLGTSVVK